MYGKDWKSIKELIPSRTLTQIRSHAQKYFIRLETEKYNSQDEFSEPEGFSSYSMRRCNLKEEADRETGMALNQNTNPLGFPNEQQVNPVAFHILEKLLD